MGEAYQCDRCEELCEGYPERIVWDDRERPTTHRERQEGEELCPDCSEQYERFMDGAKVYRAMGVAMEDRSFDIKFTVGDEVEYTDLFDMYPSTTVGDYPSWLGELDNFMEGEHNRNY